MFLASFIAQTGPYHWERLFLFEPWGRDTGRQQATGREQPCNGHHRCNSVPPIWPPDTNLVIVPGAHVKLSQQSILIKVICRDAFDNVRTDLLFDCAFPLPKAIPNMVRKCLANSIRDCTVRNGHYNASAACVHQRLLTDVDYDAKLGRLVSNISSSIP